MKYKFNWLKLYLPFLATDADSFLMHFWGAGVPVQSNLTDSLVTGDLSCLVEFNCSLKKVYISRVPVLSWTQSLSLYRFFSFCIAANVTFIPENCIFVSSFVEYYATATASISGFREIMIANALFFLQVIQWPTERALTIPTFVLLSQCSLWSFSISVFWSIFHCLAESYVKRCRQPFIMPQTAHIFSFI